MNLPGYDFWKTQSPHEGPTCTSCGELMEEVYTGTAPPYHECPYCKDEEDDDGKA